MIWLIWIITGYLVHRYLPPRYQGGLLVILLCGPLVWAKTLVALWQLMRAKK